METIARATNTIHTKTSHLSLELKKLSCVSQLISRHDTVVHQLKKQSHRVLHDIVSYDIVSHGVAGPSSKFVDRPLGIGACPNATYACPNNIYKLLVKGDGIKFFHFTVSVFQLRRK